MSVLGSQVDVDMEESVPDPVPKHQGHTGTGCYKLHDHEFRRPRGRPPPPRKGDGGLPGGGSGSGGGAVNNQHFAALTGPMNAAGGAATAALTTAAGLSSGVAQPPANLMDLPVSDVMGGSTVQVGPVSGSMAFNTSKPMKNVMSPVAQRTPVGQLFFYHDLFLISKSENYRFFCLIKL